MTSVPTEAIPLPALVLFLFQCCACVWGIRRLVGGVLHGQLRLAQRHHLHRLNRDGGVVSSQDHALGARGGTQRGVASKG